MGKRVGKRRLTVNARLRGLRKLADEAGGVVKCDGCGVLLPHERAIYVTVRDGTSAYCFPCAIASDEGAVVQLLWDMSEWADGSPTDRSEGGREFVPPRYPGVLESDQG
jgi:hypothetical protein